MIVSYNLYMNNCIFCKIINKEITTNFTYEDDNFVAFLDINPKTDGHTLLIPKEHYVWIQETPDEIIGKIFITAKKLVQKLIEEKKCEFVKVEIIGKDVPHFHIHLIPQYRN
jgi:histidine triad (HIT) family protein